MKRPSLVVLALYLVSALVAVPAAAEIEIELGEYELTAEGLTPNGSGVVFGVAISRAGPVKRVAHFSAVVDVDLTGEISWEDEAGFPQLSIWTVTDLTTGECVSAVPEGMADRYLLDENGDPLTQGEIASGKITGGIPEASFLVVRPGDGAWKIRVADGGASDSDGAIDGSIRVKMKNLEPLREEYGRLNNTRPGDIIVIIDLRNMAYLAERIGGLGRYP
jgi:hypothetical protein